MAPVNSLLFWFVSLGLSLSSAQFVPTDGILFSVGQDNDSVNNYTAGTNLVAGGVVSYTQLNSLAGFLTDGDWGAWRNNFDELARNYPQSVLILGLYVGGQLEEINAGLHDDNINLMIDTMVSYNRPVFLRWGYEADGPWNMHDPEQFIASYQKAWTMIRQRNAQNHIAMQWQVATSCYGTYLDLPYNAWYPGDAYTEWIGVSYFTPQDCGWRELNKVARFAKSRNKPLFINEATPKRHDTREMTYALTQSDYIGTPQTPAEMWEGPHGWYKRFFDFIDEYDVRGISYINAPWADQPMWGAPYSFDTYWGRSQVQDNPEILARWLAEVNTTKWLHASPDLFARLGYTQKEYNIHDTKKEYNEPDTKNIPSGYYLFLFAVGTSVVCQLAWKWRARVFM